MRNKAPRAGPPEGSRTCNRARDASPRPRPHRGWSDGPAQSPRGRRRVPRRSGACGRHGRHPATRRALGGMHSGPQTQTQELVRVLGRDASGPADTGAGTGVGSMRVMLAATQKSSGWVRQGV